MPTPKPTHTTQTNRACYQPETYSKFLANQVGEMEEARMVTHIETCQACQAELERLAGNRKDWNEVQQHFSSNRRDSKSNLDQTRGNHSSDEPTAIENDHGSSQRDLSQVKAMLAPTDDPKMLGRLGSYEICGIVGRGSAGIVVKALDPALNRYVAIKLLAPAYANNGCSRKRFEREGRAIASVRDPHVVPIHTVDDFQGTPYIVMPYVPHGSLQQKIDSNGPLTTAEVACIGMQVAKGLSAAHQSGIVHRDVKPANVLLENGIEGAMVTDFGLARVVDEATMTRSGSISGTPQYMSPEQAKGERVDPRSDLFSLGSVMYAACTGHAPFKSESVFGIIKQVCDSSPKPILDFNPDVAPWMVGLVSKLHSKSPEDRFDTADEVAELLSQELAYSRSPNMVAKPARDWWQKDVSKKKVSPGMLVTIATSILVAAGVFAGIQMFDNPGSSSSAGNNVGGNNTSRTTPSMPPFVPTPEALALIQQEHEELPRFEQTVDATIDVKSGGTLFLDSNLGEIRIETHDQPVVEMKLVQTVAAADQDSANIQFKHLKMIYEPDTNEDDQKSLQKGRDATIIARFPSRNKMTAEEIATFTDLDELKEQLLLRNNYNYRKAEFTLLVPAQFNLHLHTSAGKIQLADIEGNVKAHSNGGMISAGSITGETRMTTNGGQITTDRLGGQAYLQTNGGQIQCGNVDDNIEARTNGGKIELGQVSGTVYAKTNGGGVTVWAASKSVVATTSAGGIRINFVGQPTAETQLQTLAGSIKIGLVEGIKFDIDANCTNGRVRGDFVEGKPSSLKHQLNGGTNKLVANANSGSIKFSVVDESELLQEMRAEREEARRQAAAENAFQTAYDLHMDGKIDEAIEAHQHAASYEGYEGIATYNLGCAWALKGEKEKAFAALNEAIEHGFDEHEQYHTDDDLNSLRSDDRYKELMDKIHNAHRNHKHGDGNCP